MTIGGKYLLLELANFSTSRGHDQIDNPFIQEKWRYVSQCLLGKMVQHQVLEDIGMMKTLHIWLL